AGVFAQLVRRAYNTGPDGEPTPSRVLANIISRTDAPSPSATAPGGDTPRATHEFVPLSRLTPSAKRELYFSEERTGPKTQPGAVRYYITLKGSAPKIFDMNFTAPDVTVTEGAVEDWTIENRAHEAHSFHIHQIHFQVVARGGAAVDEPELRDTVDLPYWDGNAADPSVTLRMDFRSPDI